MEVPRRAADRIRSVPVTAVAGYLAGVAHATAPELAQLSTRDP
jgi:hypothetical protein